MNNIENIIRSISKNHIEIPLKIQNRINYTLKNKNKRKETHYLRNFITAMISIFSTIIGTFAVYAATGGTIDGIPATDWLGIKFSNKYIEYKQPVENQKVAFGETSVELRSTLCSEGITILEFDIKLSQEDYDNLTLDKTLYTEEINNSIQETKERYRERIKNVLKEDKKYEKYFTNENDESIDDILNKIEMSDETIKDNIYYKEYKSNMEMCDKVIEQRKNSGYKVGLALNVNQKGGTYNYDIFNQNTTWYASIYIDDEPFFVNNWQKTEKISDYEYRVYTIYSLTDEILKEKDTFKITLKNNKLTSIEDWEKQNNWTSACQWFAREDEDISNLQQKYVKDIPIDFEVNVSKNQVLNDSKIIENPEIKSEFRNITHTVEKVVASPIQTIVKINHSATQQSSNAFANRYTNPNIEHLPLTREYKVYDANGNELSCFFTTNKNTLIYSDGTREDYDPHDIPNKKYSNATWENVYYLLIENTDTDYIKIVPVETIRNPVDGSNPYEVSGEIKYDMDPLIINLK